VCEEIKLPFGVVSGVGSGICVLDGVHILQAAGKVSGFFWSIGLNGIFECIFETEVYSTHTKTL